MYTCAKHCHKRWSSDKAIAKIKRCSFFCLTVYVGWPNNNIRLLELQTYRYNHTVNVNKLSRRTNGTAQTRPVCNKGITQFLPATHIRTIPCLCSQPQGITALSLRLPTKGWPGWVDLGGWLHIAMKHCHAPEIEPDTVTHLSTYRAPRWLTSLIEANALTTTPDHHQSSRGIYGVITPSSWCCIIKHWLLSQMFQLVMPTESVFSNSVIFQWFVQIYCVHVPFHFLCVKIGEIMILTKNSIISTTSSSIGGRRLWNCLPPGVTSAPTLTAFRNRLKTYIFSRSFPS